MSSADKLGMVVAVAVVIIFVGIGVGMSNVSEDVTRPSVQQQGIPSQLDSISSIKSTVSQNMGDISKLDVLIWEKDTCIEINSQTYSKAKISFDKTRYGITDEVQINVKLPKIAQNPNEVDCLFFVHSEDDEIDEGRGTNYSGNETTGLNYKYVLLVTMKERGTPISSVDPHLINYKLIETGKSTGIFTGTITLSGHGGNTLGIGPDDGTLHSHCDNKIIATITNPLGDKMREDKTSALIQCAFTIPNDLNIKSFSPIENRESDIESNESDTKSNEPFTYPIDATYDEVIIIPENVVDDGSPCVLNHTNCFEPETTYMLKHEIIKWRNLSDDKHRLMTLDGPDGMNWLTDGLMLTEEYGKEYYTQINISGTFDYECKIHSWMTGTIIVK